MRITHHKPFTKVPANNQKGVDFLTKKRVLMSRCVVWVFVTLLFNSLSVIVAEQSIAPGRSVATGNTNSSVYAYVEVNSSEAMNTSWIDIEVKVIDQAAHDRIIESQLPLHREMNRVNASFFVEQPVYISLTTMSSRIETVHNTIMSLVFGRVVPDRIFLLISKEAYLLDQGVQQIPENLLGLVAAGYLSIIYTDNIGPHRKLLPVLRRYWKKDVFIATVDDDMSRAQGYIILYQLLKTYVLHQRVDAVVALRARRISVCADPPHRALKYQTWPVVLYYKRQEMLLMPTGTGGILYKPAYFHEAVFQESFRLATGTADDLMFRLATMMNNVKVLLGCSAMYFRGQLVRSCKKDPLDAMYDEEYGGASSELYAQMLLDYLRQYEESHAAAKSASRNAAVIVKAPLSPTALPDLDLLLGNVPNQQGDTARVLSRQLGSPRSSHGAAHCTHPECDLDEESLEHVKQPVGSVHLPTNSSGIELYRRLKGHVDQPKFSSKDKDLFSINRRGGNDYSWRMALEELKQYNFSFEDVAQEHVKERGKFCFALPRSTRTERQCGVSTCTVEQS